MSQKIDIRERRYNGVDYDTLHPETNINMVLDSSNNSVGDVNGALYGDGNGNIVGASISNLNLLDNSWFTVNQRGVVTTSTNEAFISDRWHIYHGTGVVNADKTITFTATQDGAGIFQISPYRSDIVGKIVTLSIMYNNYTVESGTITVAASGNREVALPSGIILSVDTRNSREQFTINVPNGTTVTLRAVKLELGSVSTLANDVAPDYDLELLKCQGYMGGYLNAGSHNAIYRGKNLGTSVTAEQYSAISAGTFDDLYIGDYWVINGKTWRIAAFDYFLHNGDTECTTHHAVIVPDECLYNAQMNTTKDTTGGYAAVKKRGVLTDAETAIKAAFGTSHILSHRVYLTNAVANGKPSGCAWFDTICDLMNEEMVYGTGIFRPTSDGSTVPANYRVEKSQLPLFAHEPSRIINRANYWLRDIVTAANFARVNLDGAADYRVASLSLGVRPAFSIKA